MTVSVFHTSPEVYALPLLVPGFTAEFDGAPVQTKYDDYRVTASGVVTETATGRRWRFHCQADRAGFPIPSDRFGLGDVQLNYLGKRAGAPVNADHIPLAWAIVRAAWNDLCIAIRDERENEDTESLSSQERRARFRALSANREGLSGDKARRASDPVRANMARQGAAMAEIASQEAGEPRRDNVEYHAGQIARAAGLPIEANPYGINIRRARWTLGWTEAPEPARDERARLAAIRAALDSNASPHSRLATIRAALDA